MEFFFLSVLSIRELWFLHMRETKLNTNCVCDVSGERKHPSTLEKQHHHSKVIWVCHGGQHWSWLSVCLSVCWGEVVPTLCSLPPADLSQQARVLGRLRAQVLGLCHVEEDVHDVGGDVQGQGQPAPPVPFAAAAVAEHLPSELRPAHEAVVWSGTWSPFFPAGLGRRGGGGGGGGRGGEVLRGLKEGPPAVHGGVSRLVPFAPDPDRHLVVAQEVQAGLVEAQAQAGGRCAQDREQQQGLQGRQHAVSSGTGGAGRTVLTSHSHIL